MFWSRRRSRRDLTRGRSQIRVLLSPPKPSTKVDGFFFIHIHPEGSVFMNFTSKDKVHPKTLRRLSPKAFSVYAEYDPVEIYCVNELYYLRGVFEADEMTFAELDQFFSDIADALG